MAFELIKVSELPELTTPADANVLPIQDGDYLKRISFENLKEAVTDDVADDLAAEVTAREGAVSDEATARGNADTAILADLASAYSASSTYAVGDYCTKDGQLYRCTTAISTAEAWTAAHWSAVALGDDTRDLRSALTNAAQIEEIDLTNVDTTKCYDTQTIGQTPTDATSSNYYSQIIPVLKNEIYYVTGKGASAYRLWAFTNSQRVILSNAPATYIVENERIVASQDGYLYLNFNKSNSYSVIKEQSAYIDEFNEIHEILRPYKDNITCIIPRICYNTATINQAPVQSSSSNYLSQIVPVKTGDVFYVTGQVATTSNYKLWAFANASNVIVENCGDVNIAADSKIVAAQDGYLYVNFHKNYSYKLEALSISGKIIGNGTVDEVKIANLYKRKLLNFGDSIADGNGNTETGESVGYAKLIADKYYMTIGNYAVGGATITHYSSGGNYIETQVDTAITEHSGETFDFILLEGGTNDVNNAPVGELISGFDTTNCDNTTLIGSMEIIFNKLRTASPLSNIIFIIVHKMASRDWGKQIAFHDAMIQVCNKWAIPYVDIFNDGQITSYIQSVATTCFPVNEQSETGYDRTHPNRTGYDKFYNPPIIAKMKSLIM